MQRVAPDVAGVVIGPQLFRIDVVAVLIDVIHRLLELLEPVRWLLQCRDMPMIVKTLNPAVGQAWVYTGYVVLGVLRGLLRGGGRTGSASVLLAMSLACGTSCGSYRRSSRRHPVETPGRGPTEERTRANKHTVSDGQATARRA